MGARLLAGNELTASGLYEATSLCVQHPIQLVDGCNGWR